MPVTLEPTLFVAGFAVEIFRKNRCSLPASLGNFCTGHSKYSMTVLQPCCISAAICLTPGLGDLIGVCSQLFPCVGSAVAVVSTPQAAAALDLLMLFSKVAFQDTGGDCS